jgi:hypothetical protein
MKRYRIVYRGTNKRGITLSHENTYQTDAETLKDAVDEMYGFMRELNILSVRELEGKSPRNRETNQWDIHTGDYIETMFGIRKIVSLKEINDFVTITFDDWLMTIPACWTLNVIRDLGHRYS